MAAVGGELHGVGVVEQAGQRLPLAVCWAIWFLSSSILWAAIVAVF